jgi:hypothetical protein
MPSSAAVPAAQQLAEVGLVFPFVAEHGMTGEGARLS